MEHSTRVKLNYLLIFGGIYAFLNFIPFRMFMSTFPYLYFRLASYLVLTFFALFFKYYLKIEVEKPHHQLSLLLLLPFIIPCFADLSYAIIFDMEFHPEFSWKVLILETFIDLADSIVEDVIFVDVMISFLFDCLPDQRKRNLHSMLLSAGIFTLVRSYVFFSMDFDDAIFNLFVTFITVYACGYLAIYYDSEYIPITFHFLFNVPNFVIAPLMFTYETELEYYLFVSLFIVPLGFYSILMYILSEKHLMHEREGVRKQ